MISQPRNQEGLPVTGAFAKFTNGWLQWFKEVREGLNGILGGMSATARASFTMTFTNVPLGSNLAMTAPAAGAKTGDFVLLRPSMSTVGLIFSGAVLNDGVVTVYAQNYTTDTVSSAAITFDALFIR